MLTPPGKDYAVPRAVREQAAGEEIEAVWENAVGGLTFRVGSGLGRRYLKWMPRGSGLDARAEAARLGWAISFTTVPEVLRVGADVEGSWLLTREIAGESAVSPRWRERPARAVAALGAGLRAFHEALPVAVCPFSWSAEGRLASARERAASGRIDEGDWHPEHRGLSVAAALTELALVPGPDRLVVCHGDACAPNTLLFDDGSPAGHVDLGGLGVADRWADLAVASWSAEWNYGPGWGEPLLRAYGVEPDRERIRYYRLLWDLDP